LLSRRTSVRVTFGEVTLGVVTTFLSGVGAGTWGPRPPTTFQRARVPSAARHASSKAAEVMWQDQNPKSVGARSAEEPNEVLPPDRSTEHGLVRKAGEVAAPAVRAVLPGATQISIDPRHSFHETVSVIDRQPERTPPPFVANSGGGRPPSSPRDGGLLSRTASDGGLRTLDGHQ